MVANCSRAAFRVLIAALAALAALTALPLTAASAADSLATSLLPTVWIGPSIGLTGLYAATQALGAPESYGAATTALVLGTAYFISARLCGYRWMAAVAAAWWLAMPICIALRGNILTLPFWALLCWGLLVLPGIALMKRRAPAPAAA